MSSERDRARRAAARRTPDELAAELLDLLEHQRQCTAPDLLRLAQIRAVLGWLHAHQQDLLPWT